MNQYTAPLPGCAPGPMDCYTSVQTASEFIMAIVNNAIATDPATQNTIITMLQQSGMPIPIVGVTDAADAQPGQVGEFVRMVPAPASFPVGQLTQSVSMGVLPPGDWDIWMWAQTSVLVTSLEFILNPLPPGFSSYLGTFLGSTGTAEAVILVSTTERALISVPTLVAVDLTTNANGNGPSAGVCQLIFMARRRR